MVRGHSADIFMHHGMIWRTAVRIGICYIIGCPTLFVPKGDDIFSPEWLLDGSICLHFRSHVAMTVDAFAPK